jgi:ribonuclease III
VASDGEIAPLEQQLGYRFADRSLLERALTHTSFVNEHPELDRLHNERLEFLGDAVLDLIVGHLVMERFPAVPEGDLSVMRAQMVSEPGLHALAVELHLGPHLHLGKGEEQTGGRDKPSLLANACEALVAAIYLDGGFERARQVVSPLFERRLGQLEAPGGTDHKTRLQERVQALHKQPPRYAVIGESGPDHAKTFEVEVRIRDQPLARATGRSKKLAEQAAARAALAAMGEDPSGDDPLR